MPKTKLLEQLEAMNAGGNPRLKKAKKDAVKALFDGVSGIPVGDKIAAGGDKITDGYRDALIRVLKDNKYAQVFSPTLDITNMTKADVDAFEKELIAKHKEFILSDDLKIAGIKSALEKAEAQVKADESQTQQLSAECQKLEEELTAIKEARAVIEAESKPASATTAPQPDDRSVVRRYGAAFISGVMGAVGGGIESDSEPVVEVTGGAPAPKMKMTKEAAEALLAKAVPENNFDAVVARKQAELDKKKAEKLKIEANQGKLTDLREALSAFEETKAALIDLDDTEKLVDAIKNHETATLKLNTLTRDASSLLDERIQKEVEAAYNPKPTYIIPLSTGTGSRSDMVISTGQGLMGWHFDKSVDTPEAFESYRHGSAEDGSAPVDDDAIEFEAAESPTVFVALEKAGLDGSSPAECIVARKNYGDEATPVWAVLKQELAGAKVTNLTQPPTPPTPPQPLPRMTQATYDALSEAEKTEYVEKETAYKEDKAIYEEKKAVMENAKEAMRVELPLVQAKMLLDNYKPDHGYDTIVIKIKDPVMAARVHAAVLLLMGDSPASSCSVVNTNIGSAKPGWFNSGFIKEQLGDNIYDTYKTNYKPHIQKHTAAMKKEFEAVKKENATKKEGIPKEEGFVQPEGRRPGSSR